MTNSRSSTARARLALALLSAMLLALLPSCGQTAPEGAILRLSFQGIRVSAIDSLRITFRPQLMQRFQMRPVASVEGITTEVDPADGVLVMSVPASYIRAHAVETDMVGLTPQLDIELYSDDTTPNQEPLVNVTVTQGTELIGQGSAYVMDWPLELGVTSNINVMCNMGALMQCQRM